MRIFVNPGHGGEDCGAVGYDLKESDIAYCIGARVESYLKKFGLITKLFQYDGLETICDESNKFNADIFVSIHCNACNTTANGTESFCYYDSVEGKKLATSIHNQIIKTLPQLTNRGVKEAGFFVLKYTNCPAVLVETAFIDNYHDNQLLKFRFNDFAKAIAQGILSYAGIKPDIIDFHADKILCPHCGKEFQI